MSPACSSRQTQQWFQDMTATMSDGMVNIIQNKVLRTLSSLTKSYSFGGYLKELIKEYQEKDDIAILNDEYLKGWRRVPFDEPITNTQFENIGQFNACKSLSPLKNKKDKIGTNDHHSPAKDQS